MAYAEALSYPQLAVALAVISYGYFRCHHTPHLRVHRVCHRVLLRGATNVNRVLLNFDTLGFPIFIRGIDYIIINFTGEFANNITILPVPIPGGELMAMSDDELRICVKSMLQGEFGYKTEIYEISRIEVDGRPCIRIYLSNEPDKYRGLSYFFPQGKNSINVVLTAAVPVFPVLREQFEQVIGTVKFGKNFQ